MNSPLISGSPTATSMKESSEMNSPLISTRIKELSASPPSSRHPQMIYDVFISFSLRDNRCWDFVSYLKRALSNVGLITIKYSGFEDNQMQEIAIQNSRCFIVVISKASAAFEKWLRMLAKLMDRMAETTQQVIPVFYRVNPSDVRDQSGVFMTIFDRYQAIAMKRRKDDEKQEYLEEVQRWRAAMRKISNLTGVVVTKQSVELDIIKKIRKQIFYMLYPKVVAPDRYKNLVEMPPRMHRMNMLLGLESKDDVRFVGIVGMRGIGKTTIAEVVYNNIAPKFKSSCCFIRISGHNLVSLQYQLLSKLVLEGDDIKISHEDHGAIMIKKHLSHRKVLIVLDGVDEERQIEKLAGSPNWFGPGSRIIITTRNKKVFPYFKILKYNIDLLDHDSAASLLCKHAFGDNPPDENFKHVIEKIVEKVKGNPLALIKIGSSLHGQNIDIWEEELKNYDKLIYENLFHDTFKTTYEGLDENSQEIFLDLACFFNGERVNRVIKILKLYGYGLPHIKLYLLVDKYLIDILDEKIWMHSSILRMGQEIEIERGHICMQSRFWLQEDVRRVFHEKEGLKYIQGIVIDIEEEKELAIAAKSFTDMSWLSILVINNVRLFGEIEVLPVGLRLLNWPGYPSKNLPSTFESRILLELHLPGSNIVRLWDGKKPFIFLEEIDVSDSEYLVETPDFSYALRLRRLILRNCVRLSVVHHTINSLGRLVLLDMEGCISLKSFPSNMISCKSLKTLILSNSGVECFPEIKGCMECLTELHLDGTLINDLHISIGHLTGLALLNLRNCAKLSSLPSEIGSLRSLKTLILNGCKNLGQIPLCLSKIESLEELDIGETCISDAPHAIGSLWNLKILNCERLQRNIWHSLNDLFQGVSSITDLNLSDCKLVDKDIPDDLSSFISLEILDLSGNHFVRLSESFSQLINLKALYLNDCIDLQQLPELPESLQYLGGKKSLGMLQNYDHGFSTSTSSSCDEKG